MDFSKRIGKLNPDAIFELDGYFVWCGTMTRDDNGLYYLYFSFWEKELGFDAWVTHSKVGYATGKDPFGKFEYGHQPKPATDGFTISFRTVNYYPCVFTVKFHKNMHPFAIEEWVE